MRKKVFAVLLAAVMVLTFMPTMAFAADPVDKDLSHYEVIATDIKDGDWRIITDTTENITLNVEVRNGDYVLPADKYDLFIEEEHLDDKGDQSFTPVENGKIKLGEEGTCTVIAYAVAKEGSGFTGQTSRDCYIDFCYEYSIVGCNVDFQGGRIRTDINTPMTEIFYFTEGSVIQDPVVRLNGQTLIAGTDYKIRYIEGYLDRHHVKDAEIGEFDVYWVLPKEGGMTYDSIPTAKGMYQCQVEGLGKYEGKNGQTNLQICDENQMKVTASAKTVKYSKLKKKAQTAAPLKVSNAAGYVTYIGKGTDAKSKKALKINPKNGKVTVKKGTKKGTYKMKVTVSDSGDETTNGKIVTKTISIKVK